MATYLHFFTLLCAFTYSLRQPRESLLLHPVADGLLDGLAGADEDADAAGAGDGGVEQVALEHDRRAGQQGDDDDIVLRTLALVDGQPTRRLPITSPGCSYF